MEGPGAEPEPDPEPEVEPEPVAEPHEEKPEAVLEEATPEDAQKSPSPAPTDLAPAAQEDLRVGVACPPFLIWVGTLSLLRTLSQSHQPTGMLGVHRV